jgi:outer membrane lipoprotein-sorting protein
MKAGFRRPFTTSALVATWSIMVVLAVAQAPSAPPAAKTALAEEVFKNVRVLKGISVDEFMGTMGVFSAALGISCADCHADSDTSWENYALDTIPKKGTARRMVQMMAAINQANFGGRQVITCYTCHRGSDRPRTTPSLAALYGAPPPEEPEDLVRPATGAPPADQIFDKYIRALGGAQTVAALTSFAAKGTSVGYGPEGTMRPVEIYAKAPDQRTTIIHTLDGDNTTVINGREGWVAAPHKPLPLMTLAGSDLEGVRLDAQLSFPAKIKEAFRTWRVGAPSEINDRAVQVVQGANQGGALATFYFDSESGLLVRLVRYAESKVGRLPTQFDFDDYRDVAGVKMPFKWRMAWLDGLENVELSEIQPNVAIDAAKFARPAPAKQ